MYLSNHDIKWAIETGRLIVAPKPESYDATSIDLHLDKIDQARIWNVAKAQEDGRSSGAPVPGIYIGTFDWAKFSKEYLVSPPEFAPDDSEANARHLVIRRGQDLIIKPQGFVLWQTKEQVGTTKKDPGMICFVDGKSTKARTGILVHLTAPTIHAGWNGNVTLEIANIGPFTFLLKENDVIAQLTVAMVSTYPDFGLKKGESATEGQSTVFGKPDKKPTKK